MEVRGSDYCRDDGNMYYGHVEQIASSEDRDSLLLRCPVCGRMYELRADGISAQSKREVQRSRFRVLAAMQAQAREQGRYLGGRPPYGWPERTGIRRRDRLRGLLQEYEHAA